MKLKLFIENLLKQPE
jgi:hypothetical protein